LDSILTGNLSLIIFFPLIGALLLVVLSIVKKDSDNDLKIAALVISLIEFVISLPLFFNFQKGFAGIQFEINIPWLSEFGVNYHLGIVPIVILSAWNAIHKGLREFLVIMFVLETAMIGTFSSLDMILFFVFWEAVLIPMYFLIGIWGTERRIYAAIKFFLFTAFGSGLMFIAILYLHKLHLDQFGTSSMNIFDFYKLSIPYDGIFSTQGILFIAFFLAFAIKVPMFPFHTWLPDAHVEAPTAGSVILAAVLLKMGTYGFLRFLMPLFPEATIDLLPKTQKTVSCLKN